MSSKVTILGCGASAGVPLIGCDCAVCVSHNPKNKRSRASILIERAGKTLLVDVSPDIRQQALSNGFKQVDAILITHAHADHCHGIDDVRSFNYHQNAPIPLYTDEVTLSELKQRFGYVFQPPSPYGWIRAALEPELLTDGKPIKLDEDFEVIPFAQEHGSVMSYGVRVGNMAYSPDVKAFPEASQRYLYDLDVWIVDCLSRGEKPTHAHLELTLKWIKHYKPKRAILTHMSHDFDYDSLRSELPESVDIAYDGMVIAFQ